MDYKPFSDLSANLKIPNKKIFWIKYKKNEVY